MRSWDLTMRGELDYRQEAGNLREVSMTKRLVKALITHSFVHQMQDIMEKSGLGAAVPYPIPGLESSKVLIMTRLFGHKVLLDKVLCNCREFIFLNCPFR